jgi:hypothetical protein
MMVRISIVGVDSLNPDALRCRLGGTTTVLRCDRSPAGHLSISRDAVEGSPYPKIGRQA